MKVLKTQIIYRQNRDDPQNKNPITLDTLSSNYQYQLLKLSSEALVALNVLICQSAHR
ncbi:hypothetical protein [Helicobacter suis]|uniref:hypothetical protein n=1 Tax=Helicobacter suis TaxID=104628 RepID=UPI0013D7F9A1|nr:hypothetical protein [Helicobacter suis]